MTFVNQIAEIVHGVVDECWGAVNKNDGDSFLIIWRLAELTAADVGSPPRRGRVVLSARPRDLKPIEVKSRRV